MQLSWLPMVVAAILCIAGCSAPVEPAPTPAPPAADAADDGMYPQIDRERNLEYLFEPVSSIDPQDGGSFVVGFGDHARNFWIDAGRSPDASAMADLARDAKASGRRVYATVDIAGAPTRKRPPSAEDASTRSWVILRLADTPDPDLR